MRKITAIAAAALLSLGSTAGATAEMDITVKYNGDVLCFNAEPVILNDKTLVQLRPIAEAMNLDIKYSQNAGSVILSDGDTTVVFTQNSDTVAVNDKKKKMDVPLVTREDYTFVPVRDLVEPFGNSIEYDVESKTVTIVHAEKAEKAPKEISTGSGEYSATFYYQSQPDLELDANGRGYCWVCSYAMLLTDVTGEKITPVDVAEINIKKGYSGSFMSGHETLAAEFGAKLVPALTETSAYYAGFNTKNKGETTLKIETDEDAYAALCEALTLHPNGVMVRYDGYPHTMAAVAFDDENIYFNDPGLKTGEHVTFENTCLKNYKLSDISYIQAMEVK